MYTIHKSILLITCLFILTQVGRSQNQSKNSILTLQIPAHQTDTITINLYPHKLGSINKMAITTKLIPRNGQVVWKLPSFDSIAYMDIKFVRNPLWNQYNYLVEPGDTISILFQPNEAVNKETNIQYAGTSIAKYAIRKSLDSLTRVIIQKGIPYPPQWDTLYFDRFFPIVKQLITSDLQQKEAILQSWKQQLSNLAYDVLLADICYQQQTGLLGQITAFEAYSNKYPDAAERNKAIQQVFNQQMAADPWLKKVSHSGRNHSMYYMHYLIHRSSKDIKYKSSGQLDAKSYWEWFEKESPLQLEKAIATLAAYYMTHGFEVTGMGTQLQESSSRMTQPQYANFISDAASKFGIGSPVFPFVLTDTKGKKVSIASFKGKTVVIDFWHTGCLPCMQLAVGLKQVKKEWKEKDKIIFMSISKDINRDTWLKSVASGKYTEPDNINLYTEGKGTNHPLILHYGFTASPRMLIIDPNGKLISTNPPNPVNPTDKKHFMQLLEQSMQ